MAKTNPSQALVDRREKLRQMAERGTEHEAAVAREKLTNLENKYDFTCAVARAAEDDLFALKSEIKMDRRKSAVILEVATADEEVGNFVKWAFLNRFGIDSHWDTMKPGRSGLRAGLEKQSAASLRPVAKQILTQFNLLWGQYSENGTARLNQRRPFFCGLYDGMMEEPRADGERIPMVSGVKKKKGRQQKVKSDASVVVETHPYETGLALGGMIRAKLPTPELTEQLRIMLGAATQ